MEKTCQRRAVELTRVKRRKGNRRQSKICEDKQITQDKMQERERERERGKDIKNIKYMTKQRGRKDSAGDNIRWKI